MNSSIFFFVSMLAIFGIGYCVQFIPQRVEDVYADPEYIESCKFYVKRHGRKSAYYLNAEGNVLKPWYNNVTVHLIFYEYLHNEYRRSFVEMHYKMCDFLQKENYAGAMFKKHGVTCPVFGDYHLMNMSFLVANFHYKMPFEKARVDVILNTTDTNHMLFRAQLHLLFKD